MTEPWDRIEGWLAAHAPEILAGLNPPASPEAIAATEQRLGIRFPDDLRAAYLRHNGQQSDAPGLLEAWEWLSLERILDEWQVWKDLLDAGDFADTQNDTDGRTVRRDWWHPAWIPLTYSGSGDHHCVDLAPGSEGVAGQIIEMWHDEGSRPVVAAGFAEWIADYADRLESGAMVMSDEYGGLCRREDVEFPEDATIAHSAHPHNDRPSSWMRFREWLASLFGGTSGR